MPDEKTITLDHEEVMMAARHIQHGSQMLLKALIAAGALEVVEVEGEPQIVEAKSDEPGEVEEDDAS